MKICAIQPPYAHKADDRDKSVDFIIEQLNRCDSTCDLILTPEYSNIPGTKPEDVTFADITRDVTPRLIQAAKNAALRCNAIVALSFLAETAPGVYRNLTRLFDRQGNVAGEYCKQHLTHTEKDVWKVDYSYTALPRQPELLVVDGIRFGFLICYDTYFQEYIANLSRRQPDIVLISSFQRGEQQSILRLQCQNIALQCNAYVLRSSYSMGQDAAVGGTSLVASPEGQLLADFHNETGCLAYELENIKHKHVRTNTFGGPLIRHDKFVEQGRTPQSCRSCGPMIVQNNLQMPYPRICAHRGFNAVAPENTMPAYGMAVAMGMQEIEFDVRFTADGVPVACHDTELGHYSNIQGNIEELTWEQVAKADCGSKFSPKFAGTTLPLIEDIFAKFSRHVIFNMHIKAFEGNKISTDEKLFRRQFKLLLDLLDKYDCREHVYFMASSKVQEIALDLAPDIQRCMSSSEGRFEIIERALDFKCQKVQFFLDGISQEMIDRAHAHGLLCNYFYTDEPAEAVKYMKMGVDTILTNDCLAISNALKTPKD